MPKLFSPLVFPGSILDMLFICLFIYLFIFLGTDLLHCTNEPNVSIPQLANLLIERSQNSNWVVVFKSLVTTHHLMCYGNEVIYHQSFYVSLFYVLVNAYVFAWFRLYSDSPSILRPVTAASNSTTSSTRAMWQVNSQKLF